MHSFTDNIIIHIIRVQGDILISRKIWMWRWVYVFVEPLECGVGNEPHQPKTIVFRTAVEYRDMNTASINQQKDIIGETGRTGQPIHTASTS